SSARRSDSCASRGSLGELLLAGSGDELRGGPGVAENFLEAALGDDFHPGLREGIVACQLFRRARDRGRLVAECEEEIVSQAEGEQLVDVARPRQALDTQHHLTA